MWSDGRFGRRHGIDYGRPKRPGLHGNRALLHEENLPHPLTRYRCDVWASCPVGRLCSKQRPRIVEIGPHYGAVQRQREKMANADTRKSLKRRSEIIERLFGQIKGNDGFQRWTFRGKEKVAAQWTMICTAINLRQLITVAGLRGLARG